MESDVLDIALYDKGLMKSDNVLSDVFQLFIQEIQLAFHIQLNEIWGNTEYIDLEQYIFSTKLWKSEIERDIREYIAHNCHHAQYNTFECNVETIYSEEIKRTILIVNVVVNNLQNGSVKKSVNLQFNFR